MPGVVVTMKELANLAPIIIGFLLTTVLGGLLGSFFQNRTWDHQNKIQQAEQERLHETQLAEEKREKALQIFDEISRLMDKRLYRLRLVYWSLPAEEGQAGHSPSAESRFEDYRQALHEWNDSINRNLALLQHYFGQGMRDRLDYEVGASFVELGLIIEKWWKSGVPPEQGHSFDSRLQNLRNLVYTFNLDMIRAILAKVVGWQLRTPLTLLMHAHRHERVL
jgi:Rad3-related DNA helicase